MSREKLFFPFAVFFISALVLIISAIHFLVPTSEIKPNAVYKESAEVIAFYDRFEENRKAARVSIEDSRVIASNWIKKEKSKISRHLFYRRRAYDLIAKTILEAQSYDELNHQLSRLPSTEKHA